ncbi:hypothetical protein [Gordonia caeni]|uniref:PE-PPE domain-containing protein n=1 Tax=Gordonia caeni TaxID=1007097 RepID=A0ABP7P354_9ACTN
MIRSLNRRTRRRLSRSKVGAGVSVAAAAALFASGLTAPPAQALEIPGVSGECAPGDPVGDPPSGADCANASPWIVGPVIDAIIEAVAPDLGVNVTDLNRAFVILGAGTSTISGSGFNMALGGFGNATANAQTPLSGAIAIGVGGEANATASLGSVSLAAAIGGDANGNALPLGVTAVVAVGGDASATALGGFAGAFPTLNEEGDEQGPNRAVCTALYATASYTDTAGATTSCTSVLFIFQQSQDADGPVVYAIKNPLSLGLASPLGALESLLELFDEDLAGLAGTGFLPVFEEDLIRIVMNDDGPTIESDLFGPGAPEPEPEPEILTASATESESAVNTLSAGEAPERDEAPSGALTDDGTTDSADTELTGDTTPETGSGGDGSGNTGGESENLSDSGDDSGDAGESESAGAADDSGDETGSLELE